MNHQRCNTWLICVTLFAASVCPAQASDASSSDAVHSHWYLGAGIAQFTLDNDHPSIGSRSGAGPYLLGGVQIFDRLSFEFSTASTDISVAATCDPNVPQTCTMPYYPADSAEYANLLMGIRLGFPLANYPNLTPWIATGFAYHFYNWDTYWYFVDGSAPFIGAGLDIGVGERWGIRLEVNHTSYSSTDNYGTGGFSGSTTQYDAALVYSFR